MKTTGLIVQVEERHLDLLLRTLSYVPHVSVCSATDGRIALLLDTDEIHVLTQSAKEIQEMKGVIGVYPVFPPESLFLKDGEKG